MWTLQPPSPPHRLLPQHVGKVIVIIIVVIDVIVNVVVVVVVVFVVILSSLSSLFFVILFVIVVINVVVVIAVITIALSSFVALTTIAFAVTVTVILREVDCCLVSRIFLTDPLGCSNHDDSVHVDTPTTTPTPQTSSTTCWQRL